MTMRDDMEALAGEYVLGTLDPVERASVAARRQREAGLDAAIVAWEHRLAALNEATAAVAPPQAVWDKIQASLAGTSPGGISSASGGEIVELRNRLNFWRRSAMAASALAASLVIAVGVREMTPPPKSKNLVAVLQKDAQSPAFLVSVNVDDRIMTVRPVAAKHETGKSFELWIIDDSLGKPKSLGVIDEATPMRKPILANYNPDVIERSTYAVTLEPEGGSPTGDPTGPVLFAGKMIETSN
ncbi:MAG: anti-sigma factor [Hyphomicrobium sp.]